MTLTHMNAEGRARMVDVSDKPVTARHAVARSSIRMAPEALAAIKAGAVAKGDVLAVAQIAGVMAAKQTGAWIPMCHPLPISGVDLSFKLNEKLSQVEITARVSVKGPTGGEMEAMTAASAAALTIYDMTKALDKAMVIGPTYLVSKEGGKSGPFAIFRAQATALSDTVGLRRTLDLASGAEVLLLPDGAESDNDRPTVWLNQNELNTLSPGACLEAGPLRLEVLYARERGWVAEINDAGQLRPGDMLESAS